MQFGIDFGTTRTVVAVRDRGNFPIVGFELPDGTVADHWPTVVATDGEELLFGWDAMAKLTDSRWTVVRSIKRLLAGSHEGKIIVGPRTFSLPELITAFLVALRRDLLERSTAGRMGPKGEVEAWVAVPAGASSAQRFVTLDAFRQAGFVVAGMLNEPSAAGLEYAHRYRKTITSQREDVLVYDLGGGTFDVSLVRMAQGDHEVRAHAGDNHLGGDDFDALLLQMVLEAAERQDTLSGAERTRLLEACRGHKERLSPNTRRIAVDLEDGTPVTVSCSDFYDRCLPLVERSLEAVARVLPAGTGEERFDCETLAGVYVVGGASDLPVVARRLREVFGRRVKRSTYSSGATAVGLAIAFEEDAPRIADRFSRAFGVFREMEAGSDVHFDAILTPEVEVLDKGTELVRRYHPVHNLGCYRYAECDRVENGVPVGDLLPWGVVRFPFDPSLREMSDQKLDKVPVRRLPAPGPLVEERYRIDRTGIVEVRITDLDSGFSQSHRLGSATW
jgi:molecular chaperone DnaK (HSP70)